MTNKYPGKCGRCGNPVSAGAGTTQFEQGKWIVYHRAGECPEITSGLGIGGVGSDDYNIHTEGPTPPIPAGNPRHNGGGQLWEQCPFCGNEPVHLDCGYCDNHCRC